MAGGSIRSWARENVDSRWAREGDSWDFELIRIQLAAARGAEERRESLGLCLARCAPATGEYHDSYLAEKCAETILEALHFPRDAAERAAFIQGHLHLDRVREAAISEALAVKDFSRAESLARAGIEKAERGHCRGTAEGYARRLVEVLDAAGRKAEAEVIIEAHAIKERSLEWFKTLKKRIHEKAVWELVRERVIAAVAPLSKDFHAVILAAEGLVERLAELARARPALMAEHYRQIPSLRHLLLVDQ
ncbi:MAG: hypothetical protein Q8M76_02440, partial [Spirochaetaceae bacterium]|nr:hypothetical protein [Spirochaetaceae bacterium]